MESISANSATASSNALNISTNSEKIDYLYCINNIDTITGEYCSEWASATLKKLPLWGEKVSEDEINFEWPTPEIFAQMQPDVTIQSMEFKTHR